ncbi:MAG: hypothetical protein CMD22_04555 [Flavobacteriales bacterium]|nr:hypothetical protein [Flavobacteriales bacterium]|tara:strand:+ start:3111 stop:3860 length:750 start_codon:yes stop_codon:yes gene_type:complete
MFFITSKLLTFLIKPTFWILILILFSLFSKKKRKSFILISISIYWFFGNEFITDITYRIWEEEPISISEIKDSYEYGIVLGGFSGYDNDKRRIEFNDCGDRLFYGIKLYNLGKIKKIVISGGNGQLINDGHMEADWSKDFLINCGVPEQDILIESKSRNTWENSLFTSELLKENTNKKLLLITSAWHMKRATFCFNQNNMDVDQFSTDYTQSNINLKLEHILLPNSISYERWETLIKEVIGNFVYKIKY